MRELFYQANFCAECGNALPAVPQAAPRLWWPRYFCAVCAKQRRQRSRVSRLAWPLGVLMGLLGWFAVAREAPPNAPPVVTVTASNSAVTTSQQTVQATPEQTFCGARTRRGTPCRRLVQAGQRCVQHRGRPSLLEAKQTQSTPSGKSS